MKVLSNDLLEKYADILIWGLITSRNYAGGKLNADDIIMVFYDPNALPLAEKLFRKMIEQKWHPVMRSGYTSSMELNFYNLCSDKQLTFIAPWEKKFIGSINGYIGLNAPESLTHLSHIDPEKFSKESLARKKLKRIEEKREIQGLFGWTICTVPTPALAKQAKMTLTEYREELIRACYLDKPNPVQNWRDLQTQQTEIKKWLKALEIKYFEIESKNTQLKITPGEKRKWVCGEGCNIPSFEVFMSPDWRGTEGVYYANMPSFKKGNYVKGVRLTFEKGRVTRAEAEQGEKFVIKFLNTDAGAKRTGEFSLTDKRHSPISKFMADVLFDENIGQPHGNCHIALGASYTGDSFDGSKEKITNKLKKELGFNDSVIHWDLVNTEKKTVFAKLADGQRIIIYDNGMFNY